MSAERSAGRGVGGWVRTVLFGAEDSRLRATWRVLLAVPLLWFLTGAVLTANLQSRVAVLPSGGEPFTGLTQSVLHAGILLVGLGLWGRYVERRPLSAFGVSASGRWLLDMVAGFVAVLVGFGVWAAASAALGWSRVSVAPSGPDGSIAAPLLLLVALWLHVWAQDVVFFRVVIENAAEGLSSRGVAPPRSVVIGLAVAVLWFFAPHRVAGPVDALDLAVAGGVFGLLYLHTAELALPIGVHLGMNYGGGPLFGYGTGDGLQVVHVVQSLPAAVPGQARNWTVLAVAYLLALAWLRWRRGEVRLVRAIARRDAP